MRVLITPQTGCALVPFLGPLEIGVQCYAPNFGGYNNILFLFSLSQIKFKVVPTSGVCGSKAEAAVW